MKSGLGRKRYNNVRSLCFNYRICKLLKMNMKDEKALGYTDGFS